MTRPCIICCREKCDGFYYELFGPDGSVHYRFADRNCSIGEDYDKLKKERGKKCGYFLKKIRCEMMDDEVYKNRYEVCKNWVVVRNGINHD